MSETTTSDHRFYDRCFVTATARDGAMSAVMSMGVYKNMNVIDGFLAVVANGRQYNVRVSRALRDRFETEVNGLRYQVVEPMKAVRISLEPGRYPIACLLDWRGRIAPLLEDRWWGTHSIVNERLTVDVRRYEQPGEVNGWIEVEGQRFEVKNWFGGRDHSWGVRPGVGGFEPYNGGSMLNGEGMLLSWFLFETDEFAGFVSRTEDDRGRMNGLDGLIRWPAERNRSDLKIVDATLDVQFPQGSRYYDRARMIAAAADGSEWTIDVEPLGTGTICRGGGYDGGWNDKRGLGVYRGPSYVEQDIFEDIAHPKSVKIVSTGERLPHNQREQIARVTVNGLRGYADCTIIAMGNLPKYGLTADTTVRP